ncbi:MAG: RNA polymerase-binding protein DksA [Rhodospirillaceae bacterium]|mgnify:FL=1|jgi:DnaK suppressor protein|nr:RNA polymerase-binding protein DksA [Rhodospirillaceae bacterium]MBT7363522.1 RNA polymerase-binding protein DksA [Rhodospirillaceae bacterium]
MSSNMLSPDYTPTDKEDFMNPMMQEFFRQRLTAWREELLRESGLTLQTMQTTSVQESDIADRASQESERTLELRTRDRERKLISKIDSALRRIETEEYGYCEDTGEPIGVGRLIARPIATLSIEAQERHERMEKTYRDE